MASSRENSFSIIQYHRGTGSEQKSTGLKLSDGFGTQNSVEKDKKEILTENSENIIKNEVSEDTEKVVNYGSQTSRMGVNDNLTIRTEVIKLKIEKSVVIKHTSDLDYRFTNIEHKDPCSTITNSENVHKETVIKKEPDLEPIKPDVPEASEEESQVFIKQIGLECTKEKEHGGAEESEDWLSHNKKKRKLSETNTDTRSVFTSNTFAEKLEASNAHVVNDPGEVSYLEQAGDPVKANYGEQPDNLHKANCVEQPCDPDDVDDTNTVYDESTVEASDNIDSDEPKETARTKETTKGEDPADVQGVIKAESAEETKAAAKNKEPVKTKEATKVPDAAKTKAAKVKETTKVKEGLKSKETAKAKEAVEAAEINEVNETNEVNEDDLESEFDDEDDEEDESNKPRRRGRCKKNPDIIPSHLSSDIVLGYKILLKFLETPQFSGFHKPFKRGTETEDCKITCLNQIKKKFEENSYNRVCEFVNDVREMLINIYESRNPIAIKKALRLEQILEQRIAQLPNYLRPQCALVLSPDEVNNSHNKIRITKGGGFVSLLLEKTEKKRYEKNKEKRKILAEERKQLKEEQDKDVQEWEKNVLLKDFEEEIKSMWELPAIGHFIHLCADIFNIGEVAQFEIERMLLMPQCSDTLDLIMTALLTNSLVRAKLDRTPSMPYSIWGPLVRTRVMSWYRAWHKEDRNEYKLFEEIGIEPEFWQVLGPDINPLDYYYFHEISLLQRVWVLKTLCDVDFVRKKTVYDNIRAQTLDELNPVYLGLDQQGNRYIQFKQFSGSDIRIYRQCTKLEGDITPSELVESIAGFELREGPITSEKVFRDIWELNEKPEVKTRKKKLVKVKKGRHFPKVAPDVTERKNLRRSVRAKQKTYVDWSDSDHSDTDLNTLRNKLTKTEVETLYRPFSDKEFISLSIFRLPRDKVKPTPKKSSYTARRTEESGRSDPSSVEKSIKTECEDKNLKTCCEDESSSSLDTKQMRDIRRDFEKIFQNNGHEIDLTDINNMGELEDGELKFTVKNIENLKLVLKKGASGEGDSKENEAGDPEKVEEKEGANVRDKDHDTLYKYDVPSHLKPDSSQFYLVVDSVEGLRQLISKFGSHENDLEIITRSTKSKKKSTHTYSNGEAQLIEKLQNLLWELEPWELDLVKSCRSNREKMYKEYMNFMNRPPDFVHPNESYWMKTYEEPPATTASSTATTTTTTTTTTATIADGSATEGDKSSKEGVIIPNEVTEGNSLDGSLDSLVLRKRTRVTRLQPQPQTDDLDDEFDDGDEEESNESDDNWVLPTPKKKTKKETTSRTPRFPKRSSSRKTKSLPLEKTDRATSSGEKLQQSSPDKGKKALFWGPRSSDPSEDLNWETNRQKILEKHNSPVKIGLFKSDDVATETCELEMTSLLGQQCDNPSTSVIMSSYRFRNMQIPGNKKPYYTAAQLKEMEEEAKKRRDEGTAEKRVSGTRPIVPKPISNAADSSAAIPVDSVTKAKNKSPRIVQTYSRVKKVLPKPADANATPIQISTAEVKTLNSHQMVTIGPQIVGQIQGSINSIQPVARIQQIQVENSSGQIPQNKPGVRLPQSVQWSPKIITLQSVNQAGKIVQPQSQVQIQGQPQVQLQNSAQVPMQGQVQQVIHLDPQNLTAVQQPVQVQADQLGAMLQTPSQNLTTDSDLYLTDGKHLIKFDNFVQRLQNDIPLDVKKTLLLVKPKLDSNPSTSQSQGQTQTAVSQQNILVINKPTGVQQTVAPSSVPNFVISGNYIINEGSQVQSSNEPQSVKIIQQSPAYVIQQKQGVNKGSQAQVIKIITSQPMATNQNVILSPANIGVASQVLQTVTQTVTSTQPTKSSSLRFVRPQMTTSTATNATQSKSNQVHSPLLVNNVIPIQGQVPKPQASIVAGRIVSTAVPAVRMTTPMASQTVISTSSDNSVPLGQMRSVACQQTQPVVASTSLNSQVIRPGTNVIAQQVRHGSQTLQGHGSVSVSTSSAGTQTLKMVASGASHSTLTAVSSANQTQAIFTQPAGLETSGSQTVISSNLNSHIIKSAANLHPVKLVASTQSQTLISSEDSSCQPMKSSSPMGTQTVRLIPQPDIIETQTAVASTSQGSQTSPGTSNSTPLKIVTGVESQQFQTQTMVPSVNLNCQTVRLTPGVNSQPIRFVTAGQQSQPVRLVGNNSVGVRFVNRNATPVKAAVIATPVSGMRASGIVCQPVRFQTVVQPAGVRPSQNRLQLTSTKKAVDANALANAPIIVIENEEGTPSLDDKLPESPVTIDFIRGELSVKKTSQGWKYAVRASNGKDVILTDEQVYERLKANNGVMK